MSGFFAMARNDGDALEKRFLEESAARLKYRGPDGTNVWTDGRVGGCFTTMLAGPAKQAATQPVAFKDRYLLWGEVRLGGREELLAILQRETKEPIPNRRAKNFCCLPGTSGPTPACRGSSAIIRSGCGTRAKNAFGAQEI